MDRNNNVIRTKPIGITSDDKFPVSYQSANTFFHFVNKFNYLNEMIYEKENDNSSDGVIYIPVL